MPSPFASSLLFGYVANYIYDGDAPLAERRAQALSIDQAQLRELLGEAELRELLDADALAESSGSCSTSTPSTTRDRSTACTICCCRLGDLTATEIARARAGSPRQTRCDRARCATRRAITVHIGGEPRCMPVEYAARYRDALGVPLPVGLPESLLAAVAERRAQDLARRYARTHGPFTTAEFAARYGLGRVDRGRDAEGARGGRPAARGRVPARRAPAASGATPTCCSPIRRRSLARLRKQVEPVDPAVFGRLLTALAGGRPAAARPRRAARRDREPPGCAAARLDLRVARFSPRASRATTPPISTRCTAAGEVVWCGRRAARRPRRPPGALPDRPPAASAPCRPPWRTLSPREQAILDAPADRRARRSSRAARRARAAASPARRSMRSGISCGRGLLTNDTFHALRAFTRPPDAPAAKPPGRAPHVSQPACRPAHPPKAAGRWSPIAPAQPVSPHGVVDRDRAAAARRATVC